MQRYRRWMAVDGGDSAAQPLSGKKGMATKECGRSLDGGGQKLSPVVTI